MNPFKFSEVVAMNWYDHLYRGPVAYLTGHRTVKLTNAQAESLSRKINDEREKRIAAAQTAQEEQGK